MDPTDGTGGEPASPTVTDAGVVDPAAAVVDPAAVVVETPAPGSEGDPAAAVVEAAAAAEAAKVAAAAKKQPNLTARLAALSTEKREAQKAARAAEQKATQLAERLAPLDAMLARAQSGDLSVIPQLFKATGLDFKKVVEFHAGQGEEPTVDPIAELKNEIADLRKTRDEETKAAATRAQQANIATTLGGIAGTIKANAEKFEICARLGDEAARDVFKGVSDAWVEAGSPDLEPGEFEEAVLAQIEVQEMAYEKRGALLAKKARAAAAPAAATALATKNSDLPADISGGPMSDKDEDILNGLIDKSAPGASSQRAKPRTISSALGGSAPPRTVSRGDMDPREALRELLGPMVHQTAS